MIYLLESEGEAERTLQAVHDVKESAARPSLYHAPVSSIFEIKNKVDNYRTSYSK